MRKLLSAALYRCRVSRLFWLLLLVPLLFGIWCGNALEYAIAEAYFLPVFLACAVFISLSMGREYDEKTLRNKIIAGYTRGQILLSECLLHAFVCVAMAVVFMMGFVMTAFPLLGKVPVGLLARAAIVFPLICIAWGALFTAICVFLRKRAVAAIVTVLLVPALMLVALPVINALESSPYLPVNHFDEEGNLTQTDYVKNPSYVRGVPRKLLAFAERINPYGQAFRCADALTLYLYQRIDLTQDPQWVAEQEEKEETLCALSFYALGVTALAGGACYLAFRKQDVE